MFLVIVVPKGRNTKRPNLKSCKPTGINTTVMQQRPPYMNIAAAYSQPAKIAQIILTTNLNPFNFVNLGENPNGHKASLASLKNCNPIGMKMMLMKHTIAATQ